MDYTETLSDPTLLLGFKELISDPDAHVVKRTTRVFTNVYNHSLRLLSEDKIDEETLLRAWPYLSDIIDTIFSMFTSTENEGILLILVKFLECSVDRHLTSDFSKYTEFSQKSRDYVKRGLRALKELVSTPYVGGSVFIVALKAIIRIACLREDLHEPVINLVKKLLGSLPPTLFDHNVRSLNKILQFNLFRLLKKAKCPTLKKKLIDMMVSTGASRRSLAPWTPKEVVVPKRKVLQQNIDDLILGRISPPSKRPKVETEPKIDPVKNLKPVNVSVSALPKSSLQFLSSLLPRLSSSDREEKEICNKLSIDKVCSLILSNLTFLPDVMPKSFPVEFSDKTVVSEDITVMRTHLAKMFVGLFNSEQLKSFLSESTASPKLVKENTKTLEMPVAVQTTGKFSHTKQLKPISSEANALPIKKTNSVAKEPELPMKTQTIEHFSVSDVDMRKLVKTCKELQDVDMRVLTKIAGRPTVGSPPLAAPRQKNGPEAKSMLLNDSSSRVIRRDPRLTNKTTSNKSPSPESSPNPQVSKETVSQSSKDPRLENRSKPNLETSKENVRQDPRIVSGNLKPRNAPIISEPAKPPPLMNPNTFNENRCNNIPMNYQNNTNHMLPNMPYLINNPQNVDFQNQFCNNDPRNFVPQFDHQNSMGGGYPNCNYRGQGNNFNPYAYHPNNGRFQP